MNILSLRLSLQARQTPENFTAQITASNYAHCGAGAVEVTGIRYLRLRLHCAAHQTGLLEASAIR